MIKNVIKQLFYCQRRFFRMGVTNFRPVDISYSVCPTINDNIVQSLPTMVIIHGLFGSKKNFDSLAKVFYKRSGMQVISIDVRNHGDSSHSPDMSYESMAEDVRSLMGRLKVKDGVLLGHSMGGKIAMTLALLQPELVRGLVVVDIIPDRSVTADTDFFPRMIKKLMSINFDNSKDVSIITARRSASKELAGVVEDQRVRDFLLTNLIQREGKIFWRLNLAAISEYYECLMTFPNFDGRAYDGKTIFIGGSLSDMISDKHRPIIKKFFPNSEISHVIGSGHWVHADNPQEFSNLVVQFIQGLQPATESELII